MKSFLLLGLLVGATASHAADKFTSTYTDTEITGCQATMSEDEIPEGGDTPMSCKGPKGFSIVESYSALDNMRIAYEGDSPVTNNLQPSSDCGHGSYGRMMEWRLHNGRPFALIYRITCYNDNVMSGNDRTPENRTGEYLVVQPLSKVGPAAEFDALRTKNANVLARKAADDLER